MFLLLMMMKELILQAVTNPKDLHIPTYHNQQRRMPSIPKGLDIKIIKEILIRRNCLN